MQILMRRLLTVASKVLSRFLWFFSTRAGIAYVFLTCFVICTTVGAFLIYPPAGWITLGITSGVYGYLLGSE